MRIMFLWPLLLIHSLQPAAAVTPDEVRALGYAGDVAGLESAMAEAHRQTLAGEISHEDLRALNIALITTHPVTLATTDRWLETFPNSPYANALRAFQYQTMGFNLRGSSVARNTPRDALLAFRDLQERAMDHAVMAYENGPDYAPASDAIFNSQSITKRFSRSVILGMIANLMEVQPNIGSLRRGAAFADERWGGTGQRDLVMLCEEYADRIPDPAYDTDVCIAQLTFAYGAHDEAALADAWRRLGDRHSAILDRERAWLTTSTVERFRTDEEKRIVRSYLTGAGRADYQVAERYARTFDAREQEFRDLIREVANNAILEARAEIEHDPYNPKLIDVILGRSFLFTIAKPDYTLDHNDPRIAILRARMAVARPFHAKSWFDAAMSQPADQESMLSGVADPYYANAIYYSGHDRASLEFLMFRKMRTYLPAYIAAQQGAPSPFAPEIEAEHIICPILRIDRLLTQSCRADGLGPESCPEAAKIQPEFREVVATATATAAARGICAFERSAPVADLRFSEVPVDLSILAEPLEFNEE